LGGTNYPKTETRKRKKNIQIKERGVKVGPPTWELGRKGLGKGQGEGRGRLQSEGNCKKLSKNKASKGKREKALIRPWVRGVGTGEKGGWGFFEVWNHRFGRGTHWGKGPQDRFRRTFLAQTMGNSGGKKNIVE